MNGTRHPIKFWYSSDNFILPKASGGSLTISLVDGASNTNLVLPESGTVTTQAEVKAEISTGSNLVTSPTGAIGYGTGAGGTVTHLTSKGTAVTLNKPTGVIISSDATLAAGAVVGFRFNNSLVAANDKVEVEAVFGAVYYNVFVYHSLVGATFIAIENKSGTSRSDAVPIKFAIIKGATA